MKRLSRPAMCRRMLGKLAVSLKPSHAIGRGSNRKSVVLFDRQNRVNRFVVGISMLRSIRRKQEIGGNVPRQSPIGRLAALTPMPSSPPKIDCEKLRGRGERVKLRICGQATA